MSDEELQALIDNEMKNPLEDLSDEELSQMVKWGEMTDDFEKPEDENASGAYQNVLEKGLSKAGKIIAPYAEPVLKGLNVVDAVTFKPIRGGLSEAMKAAREEKEAGKEAGFFDVVGADKFVEGFAQHFGDAESETNFAEEFGRGVGLSTENLSEIAPERFSEDPEEYRKPFVWQKGGLFDTSPAKAVGSIPEGAIRPETPIAYYGPGLAKQALSKTADVAVDLGGKAIRGTVDTGSKLISKVFRRGGGGPPGGAAGVMEGPVEWSRAGAAGLSTGQKLSEAGHIAAQSFVESLANTPDELAKMTDVKINPKKTQFDKTIDKFGLDPALKEHPNLEFERDSRPSKLFKKEAQFSPSRDLADFHDQSIDSIKNKIDDVVREASGGEIIGTPEQAGEHLAEASNDAEKNFRKSIDISYSSIPDDLAGQPVSKTASENFYKKISEIGEEVDDWAESGGSDELRRQAQILKEDIARMQNLVESGDLRGTIKNMQQFGRRLSAGRLEPEIKNIRRSLYNAQKDVIFDTIEHPSLNRIAPENVQKAKQLSDLSKSLRETNAKYTKYFNDKGYVGQFFQGKLAPEKLFQKAILSGDSKGIGIIKDFLLEYNPEAWPQIKGAFFEQLKRAEGANLTKFRNAWRLKSNGSKIRAIFEPKEINDINELLDLADNVGDYYINPSRTSEVAAIGPDLAKEAQTMAQLRSQRRLLTEQARQRAAQASQPVDPLASAIGAESSQPLPDIDVPPEFQGAIKNEVIRKPISNSQKAKTLNKLNRTGKVSPKDFK